MYRILAVSLASLVFVAFTSGYMLASGRDSYPEASAGTMYPQREHRVPQSPLEPWQHPWQQPCEEAQPSPPPWGPPPKPLDPFLAEPAPAPPETPP